MGFLNFLLKIIDHLGRGNLVLTGIALFMVVSLWRKHREDHVDFLLAMVMTSPFLAALLALPVMNWMKLFLYDAPKAAALGGRRIMYFTQEVRVKYVKGHPWARLTDVAKILGIKDPAKLVKRFSGQECDSLDTDHDWLSEHGVKKLTELPLGPETPKFGAWFEKDIVKPAAKMRDRGTPYG